MPYASKAQQRKFFAMEARNELPKGTARRWAHHTDDIKSLPDRVAKEAVLAGLKAAGLFPVAPQLPAPPKPPATISSLKQAVKPIAAAKPLR